MADPQQVLAQRVHDAIVASFGPDFGDADPVIRPSSFADFQANVALPLGKRLGRPPREVAAELASHLEVSDVCEPPEVSGPGFINFRLRDEWIADQASRMLDDPRLGLAPVARPQTVVVEYSSPNIAKEMHVGHLRTTIVGDAIARVLEFAGHHVIRDNHVGDWGTQFGMLIEYLVDVGEDSPQAALLRTDPNAFYQAARRTFDSDPGFADRARKRVVDLQGGDPGTLRLWQDIVDLSMDYLHRIYGRLLVTLTDADIKGESFYNDLLPTPRPGWKTRASRRTATARCASSRPASPAGRAGRCRSSSASGTAVTTTPPPTWPPSGTGSTCCTATAPSTWSARTRPCTSRWSSRWPGRRAGSRRRTGSSTPRSAWSPRPTAAGCAPGPVTTCSSATCCRKPWTAPGWSWTSWRRRPGSSRARWMRSPRRSASGR